MMRSKILGEGFAGARTKLRLAALVSPLLLSACGATDELTTPENGESVSLQRQRLRPISECALPHVRSTVALSARRHGRSQPVGQRIPAWELLDPVHPL